MRTALALLLTLAFGALKLPAEKALKASEQTLHFRAVPLNLGLREQIGQIGFIAALSGFRAVLADFFFIQANQAWEETEWGRVLFLFRQVTTLQPRVLMFWEMAAWHMGWNASVAAARDPAQPRAALRIKAQRADFESAREFLQRGIQNNPDAPSLYEALARLYREKYHDHAKASACYARAAALPGAPVYDKRFAAYELSYCAGREREAYALLHQLYLAVPSERLPTLIARIKFLEDKLAIPISQRIPENAPPS